MVVEEGAGVEVVDGLIAAPLDEEEEDDLAGDESREERRVGGHRGNLVTSLSQLQMDALSSRSGPSAVRVES